jgi:hypothetical protein
MLANVLLKVYLEIKFKAVTVNGLGSVLQLRSFRGCHINIINSTELNTIVAWAPVT